MTLYKCKCGKEKELAKATIVLRDKKCVVKESLCKCGKYMDSEPEESLSKKKRGDKLWAGAKEKLVGERGINEPFD